MLILPGWKKKGMKAREKEWKGKVKIKEERKGRRIMAGGRVGYE